MGIVLILGLGGLVFGAGMLVLVVLLASRRPPRDDGDDAEDRR
jgi:hypothetical protein